MGWWMMDVEGGGVLIMLCFLKSVFFCIVVDIYNWKDLS